MKTEQVKIDWILKIKELCTQEEWNNVILPAVRKAELLSEPEEILLRDNDRKVKILSLDELLKQDFPAEMWRIEGILPINGQGIISGAPNVGKSWVLAEIARSVALGEPFLGNYSVTQSKVLIIDEDMGIRELKRRWEMLIGTESIKDKVFFSAFASFRLDDPRDVGRLKEIVQEKGVGLLIIDPLIGMHSFEENSSTDMRRLFQQFQELKETGVSILFAHHSRKRSFFSKGNTLEDMRGSSDIGGAVESHIAVTEDESSLVLTQTKNRNAKKIEPFKVRLYEEGGKIELKYDGVYDAKKKKREEAEEMIVEVLKDADKPLSAKEIKETLKNCEIGKTSIETALKELREQKTIKGEIVAGGGKAIYYSLPEEPVDDDSSS